MSKKEVTVYTREGKQELTMDAWFNFHDYSKLYREGELPVVETSAGVKYWFKYGELHRETGPALVWQYEDNTHFLAGVCYSEENFYKRLHEVDELPLSLALTHEEEWVRERVKRRTQ